MAQRSTEGRLASHSRCSGRRHEAPRLFRCLEKTLLHEMRVVSRATRLSEAYCREAVRRRRKMHRAATPDSSWVLFLAAASAATHVYGSVTLCD